MATADYWSSADLKGLAVNGFVKEDIMNQIIDISKISLPFTDSISSDGVKNSYSEWAKDKLSDPDLTNSSVDGADVASYNTGTGSRVGNQCQISTKAIAVTTRARKSDTIGSSDEYTRQLIQKTDECRRDVEAISLINQASQADNGDATPGLCGTMNSWIETNEDRGLGGSSGGFAAGTVSAATLGTIRALSETSIRDVCQSIYEQGADPSVLMARPAVIRRISEYMFTDTARIGIQQTETGKGGASTAVGSVKIFITDFDVELVLRANRLQPTMNAATGNDNDSVYIYDPKYWRHGYLHGYRTEPLAKTGTADKAQISVDWTLKCLAEESAGVVADVDASTAMVG